MNLRPTHAARAALLLAAAAALSAEPAGELLCNGGFEVETPASAHAALYWKAAQPNAHGDCWGSVSREDWRSHAGWYMMAIRGTWANAGQDGGVWQEAMAIPGQTYQAAAWLWADASWQAGTQEIKIEFWSADGGKLLSNKAQPFASPGEAWTQQVVTATAPADAGWVRVVVRAEQVGNAGALQVDDVSLRVP
jgi:hypothetical protein